MPRSASLLTEHPRRISGSLLGRIDPFVDVPRGEHEKLVQPSGPESSARVRETIPRARQAQRRMCEGTGKITGSEMGSADGWTVCCLGESAQGLRQAATKQKHLSAPRPHRTLKVSRTIADSAASDTVALP